MNSEELLDRLIDYAARMGKLADALPKTGLGRHVAGQIIGCGTSPAPNYAEACAAESPADFVHKFGIVLKELREGRTWLLIIIRAELQKKTKLSALLDECTQLGKMIAQSIITARGNIKR